jgi:hypothetical protein
MNSLSVVVTSSSYLAFHSCAYKDVYNEFLPDLVIGGRAAFEFALHLRVATQQLLVQLAEEFANCGFLHFHFFLFYLLVVFKLPAAFEYYMNKVEIWGKTNIHY